MIITIGFSKHKGLAIGSRLIRWWMGRPFSHTYAVLNLECFDSPTVFQAVGKGLQFISYERFTEKAIVIDEFQIEVDKNTYKIILNTCQKYSGLKYGYLQNLGYIFCEWFKIKENPFDDGMNCSETIAKLLKFKDPEAFGDKDLNLVSPADVYDYLKSKSYAEAES